MFIIASGAIQGSLFKNSLEKTIENVYAHFKKLNEIYTSDNKFDLALHIHSK